MPPTAKPFVWWPWAAAAAALFLALEAYGPALNGDFVLDDLYLPFDLPRAAEFTFYGWVKGLRPLLMFSYWVNFQMQGAEPYVYHLTNVVLHVIAAGVVTLVAWRLLELAAVAGRARSALSVFAGGLFLLHPLQTESVAYVASRSEVLSVLLYYAAFAVFLYRRAESMTLARALAIVALFGAAVSTKEHTLTLPALLLLADGFWGLGGIRKNGLLYGILALAGVAGGIQVWRVISRANTAGFRVEGLSPATYFFTQCRVLWMYVRLFFLPWGQNADPDIALSNGLLDHGAIFGLMAWVALAAAAWVYRKRFPLAAFGVWMFLLLIAPTSSVVPIRDVLAERRLYLPFLGLTLIAIEFLRRLNASPMLWTGVIALGLCAVLTYQRSAVWGSPLALWEDTVAKSPQKWRPHFQLAAAHYALGHCPEAAEAYEHTSRLGGIDATLLVNWALALDCTGRPQDALAKLQQAAELRPSAHVLAQLGMMYGKQGRMDEALEALNRAELLDARYEMTHVYRGNVFEVQGDRAAAAREYQRALAINPGNQPARESLMRVSR